MSEHFTPEHVSREHFGPAHGTGADLALVRTSWQDWAKLGANLSPVEWELATRLPGWSVRTLYAHVARSVEVLSAALDAPTDESPTVADASAYFRSFHGNRAAAARSVDETARRAARTEPNRLAQRLATGGPAVLDRAEAAAAITVSSPAGPIALPDYLLTRLVEATVHLLDLRHAVPGPGPEPAALHRVAEVLIGIPGPTAFIDTATGRAALATFPLLT